MLTPDLCQTARFLLHWTREQLAKEAGLPAAAIAAFELESMPPARSTIGKITGALEAAGIAFTTANNGETNVSLRR